ncbi:uncharacterized protein LOC120272967 isoform X2 [Dioscorea cayenensis subsp. rotundata]|uniref:Uncharacterized protein LOC120272967 isoform X2 n=1 Tax=Dioscorea cayennensis subsp. rotundata TaxID=55577 RepID=A0AB40C9Q4_DIOCR|nr:uncharacterized protein LOC120272967 isoform X2 [Dioscorea cayenensis subsp. rotundata]
MDAGPAVVDRVVIMKSTIGARCHDAKTLAEKEKRDGSDTRHFQLVPSHLQPAFDHPKLKGQKPLDPPESPKGHYNSTTTNHVLNENIQLWRVSGKSCPEGTIAIGRTTEEDILRASSIRRFGRKTISRVHCDSTASGHEHIVGYVMGEQYYGAKAGLNVWAPRVASSSKFSLSQIWVISGSFGDDLNTIETGWQISPQLYGDNSPRFFTYWTISNIVP